MVTVVNATSVVIKAKIQRTRPRPGPSMPRPRPGLSRPRPRPELLSPRSISRPNMTHNLMPIYHAPLMTIASLLLLSILSSATFSHSPSPLLFTYAENPLKSKSNDFHKLPKYTNSNIVTV